MADLKVKRLRAGLYQVTTDRGEVWTIEEREVAAGYGGGWAWFATEDGGEGVLDPVATLREAKAALA
jgi:hypothetical protein